MKALAPGLQAHLDEGTTTLAWCWRIVRADGVVMGFGSTGHRALQGLQSVDLAFGMTFAPPHFDRTPDRISVPVQGSGEPHDGRKVSFDRVVDQGRNRVCPTAG